MYFCAFLLATMLAKCQFPALGASLDKPHPHDWDILIFTQRWPATACAEWEEEKPNNNCTLPSDKNAWTIHGIWPTKYGTIGPGFCNSSWHFDMTQIITIEPDLEKYWVNVEANTQLTSLWKHEWTKHGTCAATLLPLNSELKYFTQGINWLKQYEMGNILQQSKIIPNDIGYDVNEIYKSVQAILGKNPAVECIIDKNSKQSLINEIRICFDKSLNLIDCDGIKDPMKHQYSQIITNCDSTKPVMYPNQQAQSVHEALLINNKYRTTQWQLNLYRVLQFLIWFTL